MKALETLGKPFSKVKETKSQMRESEENTTAGYAKFSGAFGVAAITERG